MKNRFSIILLMMALAFSTMPLSSVIQAQHLPDGASATSNRTPGASITVNGTTCTLIDAITAANSDTATGGCPAGSGADTITLTADVTLTSEHNNTDGGNGLPSITSEITIEGAGHTIQRSSSASDAFRILHVSFSGNLTLNQTTVTGGSGTGFSSGGGIYNGGTMTVSNSTIISNSNIQCGGISNSNNSITVSNSTISENSTTIGAGSLCNLGGSMTVSNSTISGNTSANVGGGFYNSGGSMTVSNSTISGNTSASVGGGFYNSNGSITVSNSTISGNYSSNNGGGFYNQIGSTSVSNSTIIGNNSNGDGGGIYNSRSINIVATIILSNSATGDGDEIYNSSTVTANNYNLLGDNSKSNSDAFHNFIPGATDITATSDGTNSTALASILNTTLADNGGNTQTHALVSGSPAIDAASSGEATDQRGVARPQGTGYDIGAFELETSTPVPAPTATPFNQPPSVTPLPDITVVKGAADQTINPLNYFSDPEGDVFLLSVTGNSNPSVVPNLPAGHFLGNVDRMAIQFGQVGQTEITLQAKEMRSNATVEDTFTVTVLEGPTLSMSKSVSDTSVEAGQRITYTMAITNSGPSTATDALIRDALPAGLTFVSGSVSASGITTGTVGTTLPTLASGVTLAVNQTINISFAATVDANLLANQPITNTAQVTSTEVITPVQASNVITTLAPTVAISDVKVSEGDANAVFAVALSAASALPVTVDYMIVEGTATSSDYNAIPGTLMINAGETEGQITVGIVDDELVEASETFSVQLSNASNATIADGEAVGTINDNEDADGVDDDMEDLVPNLNGEGTGDGNGDGIADSQQANVASLPNSTTGDYVTFAVANDQTLNNVQAASTPADAPQEASFSQGIFSWNATGLSAGDATSITLILHTADSANLPNSYWKFGPTPDNTTDHWYNFTFDGTTGAQIDGNTITLHFVDGQRGDSDLEANGQISDPGGPAMYSAPTALTLTDVGSQAPIARHAGVFASLALLLVGGLFVARRRKEQ